MSTRLGDRRLPGLAAAAALLSLLVAVGCGARTSPGGWDGGAGGDSGSPRRDADDPAEEDATVVDGTDPFAPPDPVYGAVGFATGMWRFAVFKLHRARNRCAVASFVGPVTDETPGLTLPPSWALERGWLGDAAACDRVSWPAPGDNVPAVGASGWAGWDETLCDIDIDLTLDFENGESERLRASGLRTDFAGCQ